MNENSDKNEHIDKIIEFEEIIKELVSEFKEIQKSSEIYLDAKSSLTEYLNI